MKEKILPLPELIPVLQDERKKGRSVVFTNGCFDIIHPGHIRFLTQAKSLGDILVIGVNSDPSIRRIKGEERPIIPLTERLELLSAFYFVDYLTPFDEDTPERVITAIKPDVLVKGGDWRKEEIVGASFVESYGGRVYSLPYHSGYSTTAIIERILSSG
ncbi:MAG: D-glycero-beta-D-manno-heptose 1-phosphate adenylyltransferase [Acidobacteria bacterium]|nr:D-glycero-beta-D-manno-heptose 1-phosphate adenylyltransferase [Acidobacteriota bacterium]